MNPQSVTQGYLDNQDSNFIRIAEADGEALSRSGQGRGGDGTALASQGWEVVDTRGTWSSQGDHSCSGLRRTLHVDPHSVGRASLPVIIHEFEDSGRTVGCCRPIDRAEFSICGCNGQSSRAYIFRKKLLDIVADGVEDLVRRVLDNGHCVGRFIVVLDQGTVGRANYDVRVPFAA